MLKYAYFVSTFLILTACHQSKESVQEIESWAAPEMVEELPEGDFTEEEWEEMMMEEENPYESTRPRGDRRPIVLSAPAGGHRAGFAGPRFPADAGHWGSASRRASRIAPPS